MFRKQTPTQALREEGAAIETAQEAGAAPEEGKKRPSGLPRGTETILLVEDEQMVLRLTRQVLEMQGYCLLEASNGREAIEICREYNGTIDLVITDVIMPQMGGRELAEKLSPLLPNAKVLYMSGYTDEAIAHHGVLDENICFLPKPFGLSVLVEKVREVLDGAP